MVLTSEIENNLWNTLIPRLVCSFRRKFFASKTEYNCTVLPKKQIFLGQPNQECEFIKYGQDHVEGLTHNCLLL